MIKTDAMKAIRIAKTVYVWCPAIMSMGFAPSDIADGFYVKAIKSNLLSVLEDWDDHSRIKMRWEEENKLYVG